MKPQAVLLAGLLAGLAVRASAAQDEPKTEEVLSKIEARLGPIENLTADVAFRLEGELKAGVRITGRLEFARGKSFRRRFGLWVQGEGMLAFEKFWSPGLAGSKEVFWGQREGAFFRAAKMDPAQPVFGESGFLDEILLIFGGDWTLADVALYPRQLLAVYPEIRAARRKEGGKELIALIAAKNIKKRGGGSRGFTLSWLFDAATFRLERLDIDVMGDKTSAVCERYARVNGIEIPERVVLKSALAKGKGSGLEILITNFKTSPEAAVGRTPAWLEDPTVPPVTTESIEALRERVKKEPDNAAWAMSLANAIASPDTLDRESARELVECLGRAVKTKPDSPALGAALYCACVSAGDRDAAEKSAAALLERKVDCPEIRGVRILLLMAENKFKEALEASDPLGTDTIFPEFKASVRILCRARMAADARELATAVEEELRGRDIATRVEMLGLLEPPMPHRGRAEGALSEKPDAVLEEFAASGKPELTLLAARAYARKKRMKEATELMVKLASEKEWLPCLRQEMEKWCDGAKAESAVLIKALAEESADPDFLLLAAETYFDEKEGEKSDRLAKRAIDRLVEEKKRAGSRSPRVFDVGEVMAFLNKLMEAGKTATAKEILLAYADPETGPVLSGQRDGHLSLIKKILGGDKEAAYDFLKAAGLRSQVLEGLDLKIADALAVLKSRMQATAPEESDVELAAGFASDAALRQEASLELLTGLLERGVQAFPRRADFHERLADLYVLSESFAKAAASYAEALQRRKEGPERNDSLAARERRYRAMDTELHRRGGTPAEDPGAFRTGWPVIVKLVHACARNNDRDGAVKRVDRFLKEFADDESAAEAIQAFERLEMADRALALRKNLFLRQTRPDPSRGSAPISTGLDLANRYLKAKKFSEAYVVGEILTELIQKGVSDTGGYRSNRPGEDDPLKRRVEELRAEVRKVFGPEDLIRVYCDGKFAPLPEEKAREAKDLVEQLDSDDLSARDSAGEKLRALGPDASPLLRRLMKDQGAEVSKRLETILVGFATQALRAEFEKP